MGNWSLSRKIGVGFGSIMILLAGVGGWAYLGIVTIVNDAEEVIHGNQLKALMVEKEVDHLNWAHEVGELINSPEVTELRVQTDPRQCAFGKWYYSEERRQAEGAVPGLEQVLARIERPHNHLHTSALTIAGNFSPDDVGPAAEIYAAETLPNLHEVKELLHEAKGLIGDHIMSDQEMLHDANSTKLAVSVLSVLAMVLGIGLGGVITRSIVGALTRVMNDLGVGSEQVSVASGQVSQSSHEMAEGASTQASSLEETSATLEELAAMTQQNASTATEANRLSTELLDVAEGGQESIVRMTDAITRIKDSADQTANIIKTIDEIAFQTNLLALNAAVEAARAGDAGKGFAVVAEEVRNLAQRSAAAAKDTADLIDQSQTNANGGVTVTQDVTQILKAIVNGINQVSGLISQVSQASDEQSRGVTEINTAVNQLDSVTQRNAANAEESASASEELSGQARELKGMVHSLDLIVRGQKGSSDQLSSVADEVIRPPLAASESGHQAAPEDWLDQMETSHPRDMESLTPAGVIPLDEDEMIEL